MDHQGQKTYYGFKIHVATDAEHGFILGGHATPANRADTKELLEVVEEAATSPGAMVFADKGYDSLDNRCSLEEMGLTDGIMYRAAKGRELTEAQRIMNRAISRLRGKVERAFGTLKRDYGLQRTRHLGVCKVKMQLLMSAMAFNIKKATLLAG